MNRRPVFLPLVLCLCASPSAASEPTAEEWARLVDLSGRQRMLSQKMSKEALLITLGVDPPHYRERLAGTMRLFGDTLSALRGGDASLGLPGVGCVRLDRQLEKVRHTYAALESIVAPLLSGGALTSQDRHHLSRLNLMLLRESDRVVKAYERMAGERLNGDAGLAVVINLAGRQRMLTQKIVKECLLVQLGAEKHKNQLHLAATKSLFERTLRGLLDGDEEISLPPADSESIRSQIGVVERLWREVEPLLELVANNRRPLTEAELRLLADASLELLEETDRVVQLFAESAAGQALGARS